MKVLANLAHAAKWRSARARCLPRHMRFPTGCNHTANQAHTNAPRIAMPARVVCRRISSRCREGGGPARDGKAVHIAVDVEFELLDRGVAGRRVVPEAPFATITPKSPAIGARPAAARWSGAGANTTPSEYTSLAVITTITAQLFGAGRTRVVSFAFQPGPRRVSTHAFTVASEIDESLTVSFDRQPRSTASAQSAPAGHRWPPSRVRAASDCGDVRVAVDPSSTNQISGRFSPGSPAADRRHVWRKVAPRARSTRIRA